MSLIKAGILVGIGFGGFFDGIVFHQVLQWHHMLTVPYPATDLHNLEINTLADGLFHVFSYVVLAIGLFWFWRAVYRLRVAPSGRLLSGCLLIGWGIFNDVEGLIDHYILQIHHVRSGPDQALWDLAFMVWGVVMIIGGWLLMRAKIESATDTD